MSKFLIAALGNIGSDYAGTRHNIGFDVADTLVAKNGGSFRADRLADVAEIKWKGKILIVVKPTTYMNLSGRSVRYWLDKEKIPIENLLVIVDDLALPLNKIRLRPSGSDAGHNGLKSLQEQLLTEKYARLRFGIGNSFAKGYQVDFVLGKWSPQELPLVKKKVEKCTEVIESFVSLGIERTMNEANKLDFTI